MCLNQAECKLIIVFKGSSLDQHLNNQAPSDSLVERSYTAPPLGGL